MTEVTLLQHTHQLQSFAPLLHPYVILFTATSYKFFFRSLDSSCFNVSCLKFIVYFNSIFCSYQAVCLMIASLSLQVDTLTSKSLSFALLLVQNFVVITKYQLDVVIIEVWMRAAASRRPFGVHQPSGRSIVQTLLGIGCCGVGRSCRVLCCCIIPC